MNKPWIAILTSMILLTSCEKEEYGNMVAEADEMTASLSWSESSGQIFCVTYDDLDYYKKHIWLADIASKNAWKITSLQTDSEPDRIIHQKDGRDGIPVSISPDGQTLLVLSYDMTYNRTVYILYDTGSDTATDLTVSSTLYLYDYFWIDDVVYARSGYGSDFRIINLATGGKLDFSEPLNSGYEYTLSPSGSMIAYMVEEWPAMAAGLVGSHLYLHILRAGSQEKTIIDLDRGESSPAILAFSPDETRIAYVRNGTEIYILDL